MDDLKNLLDVVGVFYGGTSKFDDFHNEMDRIKSGSDQGSKKNKKSTPAWALTSAKIAHTNPLGQKHEQYLRKSVKIN